MKAPSILSICLWILSRQCMAKTSGDDDQAALDFDPKTYLCFYGDLSQTDKPDPSKAPGEAPCWDHPPPENSLSKRQQFPQKPDPKKPLPGGSKPTPPTKYHYINRSRRGIFHGNPFPRIRIREDFNDAAREFIRQINLDDARTRAQDVYIEDYRMRVGWTRRFDYWPSRIPEIREIIEQNNGTNSAPRGWPANAPPPGELEVFEREPRKDEDGPEMENWMEERLLLGQAENMEGILMTNDNNFGFSYQILSDEQWQAIEEYQRQNNGTYLYQRPRQENDRQSPPPAQNVTITSNGAAWAQYPPIPPMFGPPPAIPVRAPQPAQSSSVPQPNHPPPPLPRELNRQNITEANLDELIQEELDEYHEQQHNEPQPKSPDSGAPAPKDPNQQKSEVVTRERPPPDINAPKDLLAQTSWFMLWLLAGTVVLINAIKNL